MSDEYTPTEAQVEAAALAMHRDAGPRGGYGWTEYLSQARAALAAAGVAPQGPKQNETKSGQDFVSLDAEKVAEVERAAAEKAWDEGAASVEVEVRPDPKAFGAIMHNMQVRTKIPANPYRAALPDATTGELERAHDLIELREFEIDKLYESITKLRDERDAALAATEARIDRWMQLVGKGVEQRMAAEAERDAAVAAVERVRAIHRPESNERYTWCVGCSTDEYPEDWPCPTIAALDGAPEPEGKP